MANEALTEKEINTLMLAIIKCNILQTIIDAGLPVTLNRGNFGFPDLTDEEVMATLSKLHALSHIAWLKETRGTPE
jgi:hypothetical protein